MLLKLCKKVFQFYGEPRFPTPPLITSDILR